MVFAKSVIHANTGMDFLQVEMALSNAGEIDRENADGLHPRRSIL